MIIYMLCMFMQYLKFIFLFETYQTHFVLLIIYSLKSGAQQINYNIFDTLVFLFLLLNFNYVCMYFRSQRIMRTDSFAIFYKFIVLYRSNTIKITWNNLISRRLSFLFILSSNGMNKSKSIWKERYRYKDIHNSRNATWSFQSQRSWGHYHYAHKYNVPVVSPAPNYFKTRTM